MNRTEIKREGFYCTYLYHQFSILLEIPSKSVIIRMGLIVQTPCLVVIEIISSYQGKVHTNLTSNDMIFQNLETQSYQLIIQLLV